MTSTFRDIIDLFPDRDALATQWSRKVPRGRKVTREMVTLWKHRNGIPAWAWAGLEAAATELKVKGVTVAKLVSVDHQSRLTRAAERTSHVDDRSAAEQ